MDNNEPVQYNPDIYVIEGNKNGLGYHRAVSMVRWYAIAFLSFPLRFFPLFKPYKWVKQHNKILVFRTKEMLDFLNY